MATVSVKGLTWTQKLSMIRLIWSSGSFCRGSGCLELPEHGPLDFSI